MAISFIGGGNRSKPLQVADKQLEIKQQITFDGHIGAHYSRVSFHVFYSEILLRSFQ